MAKRSNGAGSVYRRKDGRWCAQIVATDPSTGQPRRSTFYGKTQREARDKLRAAIGRRDAGAPVRDAKVSVGRWIAHWRTTTLQASDRKPATRELYSRLSKRHLDAEPFGAIQLDRLRPSDIDALLLGLRTKGLSDSTVRQVYTVARLALSDAVRDGLLAANPVEQVKRPSVKRKEAVHLSESEVQSLLDAAGNSRYHDILALIAATGLRRGEAAALTWKDIDLGAAVLRVRGTIARVDGRLLVTEPKTEKSRRVLPLSPVLLALLQSQRSRQDEERRRAGTKWHPGDFVFTTEIGTPLEPRNILRAVNEAAKTAKLEAVGVHTLRHSFATRLLDQGVHLKAVSDLLGHTSISITGDIYGHVSDETSRTAMEKAAAVLGSPSRK